MQSGNLAMKRGLRLLSRQKVQPAIEQFRRAVESYPPTRSQDLAKALFYLGMALARTGQTGLAKRSWAAANCLRLSGLTNKLSASQTGQGNQQASSAIASEDYATFKLIQTDRYLAARPAGRFVSPAEADMVSASIDMAWEVLAASKLLDGLSADCKLILFWQAQVVLPLDIF